MPASLRLGIEIAMAGVSEKLTMQVIDIQELRVFNDKDVEFLYTWKGLIIKSLGALAIKSVGKLYKSLGKLAYLPRD